MTMKNLLGIVLSVIVLIFMASDVQAEPTMTDFTAYPPFMTVAPKPNVLLLLDNSGSMLSYAYDFNDAGVSRGFDPARRYFGYFEPDLWYVYLNGRFEPTAGKSARAKIAGEWDGNFLNWLTMRRIDIARKVLIGGKAVSRTLTGNPHELIGEQADGSARGYRKEVNSAETYTPYWGTRCFEFTFGTASAADFEVSDHGGDCSAMVPGDFLDNYGVKVLLPTEPTGVIQAQGDKVRWGLEFFNEEQGGRIAKEMTDDIASSMVTAIELDKPGSWTPMAEALWTATGYFAQSPVTGDHGPRYHVTNAQSYRVGTDSDPYNYGTGGAPDYIWCAKSFVLVITDGEPTQDLNLPDQVKGYDLPYTDGGNPVPGWAGPADPNYFWYGGNNGSHYVDDVALMNHVDVVGKEYRDLRPDLEGNQYITDYFVYAAFGDPSPDGRRLLKQAARNGGFEDMNGNFIPDLPEEYDRDGNGNPDTYFEAPEGDSLAESLTAAIVDILRRTSSGTAVSILSTSAHGEGSLFQAYFKPEELTYMAGETARSNWLGYLHGLWVDDHGNLREDNGDFELVYEEDDIIRFYYDGAIGTRAMRDFVSSDQPYGDGSWDETNVPLNTLRSLWEGGEKLALRDISSKPRKIYTSLDKETLVELDPDQAAAFKDYLRASDTDQARDIIEYVRGEEVAGMRSRKVFVDIDGDTVADEEGVWRLGDIIYSTPAVVSRPLENYDDIYSDPSYGEFETHYTRGSGATPRPRPTAVYVGANDGMLHAFNAGCYLAGDDRDTARREHGRYTEDYPPYFSAELGHDPEIGEELWAYIPHSLLPHLRWLTDMNYTHVYYVDLKSKIVDVRIFPEDATHPGGWGTVLIGGLNLGGGIYEVDDFNQDSVSDDPRVFSSCYYALDITNPGAPGLLWEFSDPTHLGFTTAYPAVARTGKKDEKGAWHVILGSGPTNYAGASEQEASIFVLDLKTGDVLKRFEGGVIEGDSFMGGVATVDMNLDYQTNAAYFGNTYESGGKWYGNLLRIFISTPDEEVYSAPNNWSLSVLANTKADQAITAPPAIGADNTMTPWVYWGTGRFFSEEDKTDLSTQSFYGVKDRTLVDGHPAEAKGPADLFDVTNVSVTSGDPSTVSGSDAVPGGSSWDEMLSAMRGDEFETTYGWFLDVVDIAGAEEGERVLVKPSIFGGLAMFTSFMPNNDVCDSGGRGRLYGLYYETGTSYKKDIFSLDDPPLGTTFKRSVDLGQGKPSSLAIHIGQEEGGKVYVQQSTGTIQELVLNTPFRMKSGSVVWYEE
jgi:type IV pilus assembly protein PilY1